MTDRIERPCITGSRALRAAAQAHAFILGSRDFSAYVDALVRADLQMAGVPPPPPLRPAPNRAARAPVKPAKAPKGPDASVRWPISGSGLLFDAARSRAQALGKNLSGYLDGLVRAELVEAGLAVPPPLPPRQNGRRRQAAEARTRRK